MTTRKFGTGSIIVLACCWTLAGCDDSESTKESTIKTSVPECFAVDEAHDMARFWLGVPKQLGRPDVELTIPVDYLHPGSRDRDGKTLDGGVLIYVNVENFHPLTFETNELGDDEGLLLLTTYVPMERVLESSISTWDGRPDPVPEYPQVPAEFGLMRVDHFVAPRVGKITYFHEDSGDITDVFTCDADTPNANARCAHVFDAGILEAKISYDAEHLADWRLIRTRAEEFLNCAVTDSASLTSD